MPVTSESARAKEREKEKAGPTTQSPRARVRARREACPVLFHSAAKNR